MGASSSSAANRRTRLGGPLALSPAREAVTVLVALVVYFGGRVLIEGSAARSRANARRLIDLEAALGLDAEATIQQWAIESDLVRTVGNLSYVWLHWPLLIAALVLLIVRDPFHYRQLRNALFASGAVGLVLFATFPMAPPRFMPGFVGTVSDDARRHYLDYPLSWSNQYAAFPSFHVGWTLVACLAVAASFSNRAWRLAALVPALLVGISVITTGNHYLLDSIAGAAIALVAYVGAGLLLRRPSSQGGPIETPTIETPIVGGSVDGPAAADGAGPSFGRALGLAP